MAGKRRNRENVHNIAEYYAIEKGQRGRSQQKSGRKPRLKGTGTGKFGDD